MVTKISDSTGSHQGNLHYIDVIMTTMASQITSLMVVYSIVYSGADQRKHQSSASLAFVRGIHRDRWIPRTKGRLRGKCFHLMTSSWTFQLVGPHCGVSELSQHWISLGLVAKLGLKSTLKSSIKHHLRSQFDDILIWVQFSGKKKDVKCTSALQASDVDSEIHIHGSTPLATSPQR